MNHPRPNRNTFELQVKQDVYVHAFIVMSKYVTLNP